MNNTVYVLSLGHRVCSIHGNDVSLMTEISSGTKFSTIGDAMRKAAFLIKELGLEVKVKKL